jgi:competence ComEA-like helix-hairpin-helix protein
MIFTPEERRALLALVALLLLGQLYSMWEGARRVRPDAELSRWLARVERARGDSFPASAGLLPAPEAPLPGEATEADSAGPGSRGGDEGGGEGPEVEPASAIPPGLLETGRLRINQAGIKDLDALPGIGPSLAKRILETRAKSGPFRKPDDLLRVSGIGPKKLAALRDRIDCSLDASRPPPSPH